jgi:RNA polymerase sigma-70 factor (ECF subfamily)
MLAMLADADAVAAIDGAAFTALVQRYAPFLRRSVARLSGHGPWVDDVVQEAFVSAWRRRAALPTDDGRLRGWLFRAAKNHLAHHRRALARQKKKAAALTAAVVDQAGPLDPGDHLDHDGQREQRRKAALLQQAVLRLPDEQREVFVLAVLEGLSVVDASVVLAVNESTLRTRLSRARSSVIDTLRRLDDR